jgi:hypothetical protein
MFVTFTSRDEVLVTTLTKESLMLAEYFGPGIGRDLEDYDREESEDCAVQVLASVTPR